MACTERVPPLAAAGESEQDTAGSGGGYWREDLSLSGRNLQPAGLGPAAAGDGLGGLPGSGLLGCSLAGLPQGQGFFEMAGEILVKDLVLGPAGAGAAGGGLEGAAASGGAGGGGQSEGSKGSNSRTGSSAVGELPAGYQEVRCRLLVKPCPGESGMPRPRAAMF